MKNLSENLLRFAFLMICVGLLILFVWCLPLDEASAIPLIGSSLLMIFGILCIAVRLAWGQDHCAHCSCDECLADVDVPSIVPEKKEPPKGSS